MSTRRSLLKRLALLVAATGALAFNTAFAEPPRSYAVLALAANKITIVQPRMETGSHMDRNLHQVIDMPDESLDIVALEAAEAAIKQAQPSAAIELLATRDPKLYAIQDVFAEDTDDAPLVLERLKRVLSQTKATHLVLITKNRDDARMKLYRNFTGRGKISGVGFYVDELEQLVEVETGNYMQGYVASFAVLRFRLIDIAAARTLRVENVQASSVDPTPKSALSAWQGMSAQQKVDGLQLAIREAVGRGMPKLLAGTP
jgi:hypothetical protein